MSASKMRVVPSIFFSNKNSIHDMILSVLFLIIINFSLSKKDLDKIVFVKFDISFSISAS